MQLPQLQHASRASRALERRARLIDAARALFSENGFHATGMAQIAAASGVKVGQIYRDFAGKEDIVAAIAAADLATFLDEEGLRIAVAADDRPAVRTWMNRLFDGGVPIEKCRMVAEIYAESGRNPRIAEIHRLADAAIHTQLSAAFAALVPGAERAEDRARLIDLLMTLGSGLHHRRIAKPDLDTRRLAAHIGRLVDREISALTG